MFDIFIVIVLLWAIISGWRNGLLTELVSLGGHILGLILACIVYSSLGKYLAVEGTHTSMIINIVAFFILWVIIPIVLGFAANTLVKFLKPIGLGLVNSLGGAALSLVKFTLLLSCTLAAMSALGILDEKKTTDSRLYTPVKSVLGQVIDWAIDDEIRTIDPSEGVGTYNGDTLWVDVPHKTDAAQPETDKSSKGIKADRPAVSTSAKNNK